MQITADVSEISKTVQRDRTFILNVLSECSIHFAQFNCSCKKECCQFHIKWFLSGCFTIPRTVQSIVYVKLWISSFKDVLYSCPLFQNFAPFSTSPCLNSSHTTVCNQGQTNVMTFQNAFKRYQKLENLLSYEVIQK